MMHHAQHRLGSSKLVQHASSTNPWLLCSSCAAVRRHRQLQRGRRGATSSSSGSSSSSSSSSWPQQPLQAGAPGDAAAPPAPPQPQQQLIDVVRAQEAQQLSDGGAAAAAAAALPHARPPPPRPPPALAWLPLPVATRLRALGAFLRAAWELRAEFVSPPLPEALRRLALVLAASLVMVVVVSTIDSGWLLLYLMNARTVA